MFNKIYYNKINKKTSSVDKTFKNRSLVQKNNNQYFNNIKLNLRSR